MRGRHGVGGGSSAGAAAVAVALTAADREPATFGFSAGSEATNSLGAVTDKNRVTDQGDRVRHTKREGEREAIG